MMICSAITTQTSAAVDTTPNRTTLTTSFSITPVSYRLTVVHVTFFGGTTGIITALPTLTGNGFTYSGLLLKSRLTTSPQRYTAAYGVVPTVIAGTNGALTLTMVGPDNFDDIGFSVCDVTHIPVDGSTVLPSIASVGQDAGSATLTVPVTMTSGKALVGLYSMWDARAIPTEKAGWSEISDIGVSGSFGMQTQFLYGQDTSGVSTWDSTNACAGGVLELTEARDSTGRFQRFALQHRM